MLGEEAGSIRESIGVSDNTVCEDVSERERKRDDDLCAILHLFQSCVEDSYRVIRWTSVEWYRRLREGRGQTWEVVWSCIVDR